ncbi:MAG: cytochrome C oxidase subunit IV family protein [Verrucomicrobia bacterium]|nr:cytochrome C oxidase subunit IV family protein [Verrucomicrobiota bacterium]
MNHPTPIETPPREPGRDAAFQKNLRASIQVFIALLALLVANVAVSYAGLGRSQHIAVALLISTLQAVLAAGVLMHLKSEKRIIRVVLVFTGVFFAGLMVLTMGSFANEVTASHVH